MHKIDITVSGLTGSGKYCIAHAIQDMLQNYGIFVDIGGADASEPPLLACEWDERLKNLGNNPELDVNLQTQQKIRSRETITEKGERIIKSLDPYSDSKKIKRLSHALTEIERGEDAKEVIDREDT